MFPSAGSTNRNIPIVKLDFPAPVRPTIPIFSPPEIEHWICLSTKGSPSRYRKLYFSKSTLPLKNWLEQNKGLNKGYPKVGKFPKVDGLETLKSQSSKKNAQIKEIELVQKTHHQEFLPAQFLVETLMFSNLDRFVFGRDRVQRKYFISG